MSHTGIAPTARARNPTKPAVDPSRTPLATDTVSTATPIEFLGTVFAVTSSVEDPLLIRATDFVEQTMVPTRRGRYGEGIGFDH
jgi:hypothetical protein